jgi:dihydroxyacetone kinase-like predicted kinase
MTIELLAAGDLRSTITVFRDLLQQHQSYVNRLNVYPVPDGDTGTNMALTVASVCEELDEADDDLASICKAISHGSLMGARGNSGVILSQILRGLAGVAAEHGDGLDGAGMVRALRAASDAAYGAVMRPVEGTILTVVRAAAEGAEALDPGASLVAVLDAAKEAGADGLAHTPELLPVLADAGVVDAGGTGLLLLVDAALHVVDDRALPAAPEVDELADAIAEGHDPGHDHGGGSADLRYEVL